MGPELVLGLAILRCIPLIVLTIYAVKHEDYIALAIALLWGLALAVGSFLHRPDLAQIIASPLVVLVVWYIVRRPRA